MTQTPTPQTVSQSIPFKTYRDKILTRVILTTVALMLTGWPWMLIFAHPIASLFWEWWYFSFKKVKESSTMSQWYLESKLVTAEDVDTYIQFIVTARRIAFVNAAVFCLISPFLFKKWGLAVTVSFYSTFYLIRWGITLIALWRKDLKYPYTISINASERVFNPTEDCENMMGSVLNKRGYLHPASPNYIYKSHTSYPSL